MSFNTADTPIETLSDWLMEQALAEPELETLFEGCNRRLHAAGIPLSRAVISSSILHPLYESFSVFWTLENGISTTYHVHDSRNRDAFLSSPFYYLMKQRLPILRRRLQGQEAMLDFPVLEELAEMGMSDYLAYMVFFSAAPEASVRNGFEPGMIGSWCTDRSNGFTDADLQALNRIQQRLAVAVKMCIKQKIAGNILETYLGLDAGRKVLNGQIKRGDGERIYSVIWYSDLRDSTRLADTMDGDDYIELLNRYFECAAGSVLEYQGEVLRFPGDAVLAIFPITAEIGSTDACMRALKSASLAIDRLDELNAERSTEGLPALDFGIGLHVGDVLFGNIGVPQRLEFSVIGPAMNETARLEALTPEFGEKILTSESFVAHLEQAQCDTIGECRLLGERCLQGVDQPMNIYCYAPK